MLYTKMNKKVPDKAKQTRYLYNEEKLFDLQGQLPKFLDATSENLQIIIWI